MLNSFQGTENRHLPCSLYFEDDFEIPVTKEGRKETSQAGCFYPFVSVADNIA